MRWIIKGKLALSHMPLSILDLEEWLERGIRAIVILVEPHEVGFYWGSFKYYLSVLDSMGFEYYHSPIRDFHAPTLEQCLEIVSWIDREINKDKPVLIHCRGGIGRSGTIAVCYLIYKYCLNPGEAYSEVRKVHPNISLTIDQEMFIRDFHHYLIRRLRRIK